MSLPNIGFETGTDSVWNYFVGTCCPISTPTPTAASAYPIRFAVTSGSGVDPVGLFPIVAPGGGRHSFKVGNDRGGAEAETIKYFVHVPTGSTNYSIIFRWAAVLQDPGHSYRGQPRFAVSAYDSASGAAINCAQFFFVAGPTLYGFIPAGRGSMLFRSWTTSNVNLSGMAGSTVVLEFSSGDCFYGGHFGYGYVDMGYGLFAVETNPCDTFVTLNAPPGDSAYAWYDSATFSTFYGSTMSVNVPVTSAASTYAVVLTHYAGFGCNDTLYTRVNPASGLIRHSGSLDTAICIGPGAGLTIGTADTGSTFSYHWTPRVGLSCDTCATTFASPPSPTTYILDITNASCSFTDTFTIRGGRMLSSISGTNASCYADTNGTATVAPITGFAPYAYVWNTTPIQTTASITNLAAGSYSVMITDSTGCTDSQVITITQPPVTPVIAVYSSINPSTCLGSDGQVTLEGLVPSASYTMGYLFNGAAHTATGVATSAGFFNINALAAGTYDSLSIVGLTCPFNYAGPVTLSDPAAPSRPVAGNGGPVCVGDTIHLFVTSATPGVTYTWVNASGFTATDQNPLVVPGTLADTGFYFVTAMLAGCSATDSTMVLVKPRPVPAFTWNYPVCPYDTFRLSCSNSDSLLTYTYAWAGPNGFTSTSQNVAIEASDTTAGNYALTISLDGCVATDTMFVYPDECLYFRMANAFTPNGDGTNEHFLPVFIDEHIFNYAFSIYNRWGQLVFSTTEKTTGWDGRFHNTDQPEETYIYHVSGSLANGKKAKSVGSFVLVR